MRVSDFSQTLGTLSSVIMMIIYDHHDQLDWTASMVGNRWFMWTIDDAELVG